MVDNQIYISVVIPLYNKEKYILQTVALVLNQTYEHFELLIVDDGSTDNSLSLLSEVNDSRLRVLSKSNGGVSSARNYGITNAKYDYVAFLDADDAWKPNYLENIAHLVANYPKAKVFATNFERNYRGNKRVAATANIPEGYIENYFKLALKQTIIHTSSVTIHKSVFKEVGDFDERIARGEDMDVWTRAARTNAIAYCPIVCSSYLLGAENSSANFVPHPTNIFAYYINLKNCDDLYEFKYLKRLLIKRTLRYLLLDKKIGYFRMMVRKQFRNLIRCCNWRVF